ncbi:MAG: alpha-amylase family glycosyl hydrolase [Rhodoluna sp.]
MQKIKRTLAIVASLAIFGLTFTSISESTAEADTPSYDLVVHAPGALPKSAKVAVSLASAPATVVANSRAVAKDSYGWFGVVTVPANAGAILVSATGVTKSSTSIDPLATPEIWLDSTGTPFDSRLKAAKNIRVRLSANADAKKDRAVEITSGDQVYRADFDKNMLAVLPVPADLTKVTVKTLMKIAGRYIQTSLNIETDVSRNSELYLSDNYEGVRIGKAHSENKVIIHYRRADKKYTGWTLNALFDQSFGGAAKPNTWEKSQLPDSKVADSWGVTFTVPITGSTKMLPFILHKGSLADPVDKDQVIDVFETGGEVWIESGRVDSSGKIVLTAPVAQVDAEQVQPTMEQAEDLVGVTARSSFANDSIYFVMFDRYKNGDSNNDRGGLVGDVNVTGYLPTDIAYSHGGDLKGLADGCSKTDGSGDGIPRIKRLGFSAVWISPPFEQNFVQSGSSAYHGYFATDFTKVDPRWGTMADFKAVSDCAHRLGMKVILDIIVNHTGDVITYSNSRAFNGQVNESAYIPAGMENIKAPAFLNNLNNYNNMGAIRSWNNKLEYQKGDFGGLDDLKTENAEVVEGWADLYAMWVNDYGVDGFRIDTAKHVDDEFFTKWWKLMEEKTAETMADRGQKLFAFGEYYDGSISTLSSYIHKQGLPSVLDFAFQPAAVGFAQGESAQGLANVFRSDNSYITSTKSPYDLINFLGNHDMGRAAYLLRGGLSMSKLRSANLLAHDVMFLTRGIPKVYYGDEVGMIGSGGDKASRQDMFSTQVRLWKEEDRVWGDPIGIRSSLNLVTPLSTRLTTLNKLRQDHPALASGPQILRKQSGNVMINSKIDTANRIEYVVAFNSSTKPKTVTAQIATKSSTFTTLLGTASKVSSTSAGSITLTVPAYSTLVLKANKPYPQVSSSPKIYLSASGSSTGETIAMQAAIRGYDPGSVTFIAKVNDGQWERIGTDDAADYGMNWYYNQDRDVKIQPTDQVYLVAIYKNSSGGISMSKSIRVKLQ